MPDADIKVTIDITERIEYVSEWTVGELEERFLELFNADEHGQRDGQRELADIMVSVEGDLRRYVVEVVERLHGDEGFHKSVERYANVLGQDWTVVVRDA